MWRQINQQLLLVITVLLVATAPGFVERAAARVEGDGVSADELTPLRDHTKPVMSVAFAQGGTILFTGSQDQKTIAYKLDGRAETQIYAFDQQCGVESLAVWTVGGAPRGLFSASRTVWSNVGGLLRWTAPDGKHSLSFGAGPGEGFRCIAIAPPGLLAVGGGGATGQLRLLDITRLASLKPRNKFDDLEVKPAAAPLPAVVQKLAFRPALPGSARFELLVGCRDGAIRSFNASGAGINPGATKFEGHEKAVTGLAYFRDGKTAVSSSEDGTIRFWDSGTGKERDAARIEAGNIQAMTLSPDEKFVVAASIDNHVRFWNVASGRPALELAAGEFPLRCIDIIASSTGQNWRLAAGGDDHSVHLWNVSIMPTRQVSKPPQPRPDTAPPQSPRAPADATAPGPAGLPATVDLLPRVDPARDALTSGWQVENGELTSSDDHLSKCIRLAYHPPAEYDFAVEFTVTETIDWADVAQICSVGPHNFSWQMGGEHNTVSAICIRGRSPVGETTQVRGTDLISPHVRHRSVVSVRSDGVTACLDGKLLCSHKGFTDLDPGGANFGFGVLGLRTWNAVRFHSISVKEIGAPGQFVRRLESRDVGRSEFSIPAPVLSSISLIDLTSTFVQTTWIELMKNRAPRDEEVVVDGKPCHKYLFAHAESSIVYGIPRGAMGFRAKIVTNTANKSIRGLIYVDGNEALISKTLGQAGSQISVSLPLPNGAREIELRLSDGGNVMSAHSIWAEPEFVFGAGPEGPANRPAAGDVGTGHDQKAPQAAGAPPSVAGDDLTTASFWDGSQVNMWPNGATRSFSFHMTVIERHGNSFRARVEISSPDWQCVREVHGKVESGSISWTGQDTKELEGAHADVLPDCSGTLRTAAIALQFTVGDVHGSISLKRGAQNSR